MRKKWAEMTRDERRRANLRRFVKQGDLKHAMYMLDWPRIVKEAVEDRPTSFGMSNGSKAFEWTGISEWRNATDCISSAVIRHMREAGIIREDDLGAPLK